jgi:hypothetical protein
MLINSTQSEHFSWKKSLVVTLIEEGKEITLDKLSPGIYEVEILFENEESSRVREDNPLDIDTLYNKMKFWKFRGGNYTTAKYFVKKIGENQKTYKP